MELSMSGITTSNGEKLSSFSVLVLDSRSGIVELWDFPVVMAMISCVD